MIFLVQHECQVHQGETTNSQWYELSEVNMYYIYLSYTCDNCTSWNESRCELHIFSQSLDMEDEIGANGSIAGLFAEDGDEKAGFIN